MGLTDEVCSLQPGMTIGSLHIVSFIGKGAIGEVYLAQREILGKEFALKVIPKGFSGEDGADIFKQGARIQTKLDHPNILRIDDLGEEDLFYWLRMEHIVGKQTADKVLIRNLDDLMRHNKGPLSEEEVNYYLYYLLLGLDHAHSQGIHHEDLKPANVMIAEDGVKVAEFGVTDLIGHARSRDRCVLHHRDRRGFGRSRRLIHRLPPPRYLCRELMFLNDPQTEGVLHWLIHLALGIFHPKQFAEIAGLPEEIESIRPPEDLELMKELRRLLDNSDAATG